VGVSTGALASASAAEHGEDAPPEMRMTRDKLALANPVTSVSASHDPFVDGRDHRTLAYTAYASSKPVASRPH
jgi:hypothetical protein